jgi:hypothetical protein
MSIFMKITGTFRNKNETLRKKIIIIKCLIPRGKRVFNPRNNSKKKKKLIIKKNYIYVFY